MTAIGKRLFKTYTSLLFGVTGVDDELGGRDTSVEFWFYQKGKKSGGGGGGIQNTKDKKMPFPQGSFLLFTRHI